MRDGLAAREDLDGLAWCRAYASEADRWLGKLFGKALAEAGPVSVGSVALLAVGGYGRGELYPGSDLDVVLVHAGGGDVEGIANAIWYPIWDEGIKLDHSVRTPAEMISAASEDPRVLLGLLTARQIAGSRSLAEAACNEVRALWRREAASLLEGVLSADSARREHFGELAFLLEPDLKEAAGGLRDLTSIACFEMIDSHLSRADDTGRLGRHHELLAAARVDLQRYADRPGDRLLLQEQEGVAGQLGFRSADELMVAVARAGRAVTGAYEDILFRLGSLRRSGHGNSAAGLFRWRRGRRRAPHGAPRRHDTSRGSVVPVGDDVGVLEVSSEVLTYREVVHVNNPGSAGSASLAFRVAAVSAQRDLPIARGTLFELGKSVTATEVPWPEEVQVAFMRLLECGAAATRPLEQLSQEGILSGCISEWEHVVNLHQRNAYHRYTVDRHLIETAARAAEYKGPIADRVVLLTAALFHDIGKGLGGDHSRVGAAAARRACTAMGMKEPQVSMVSTLVRHHLVLPELATRRDVEDPVTWEKVVTAFADPGMLSMARVIAKADGESTGPSAWGGWKEHLIDRLVENVARRMEQPSGGEAATSPDGSGAVVHPRRAAVRAEAAATSQAVETEAAVPSQVSSTSVQFIEDAGISRVMVKSSDRPGLISAISAVLAMRGIDVRSADISSIGDVAIDSFVIERRIGDWPEWEMVAEEIDAVISGELKAEVELAKREQAYGRARSTRAGELVFAVSIDPDASAEDGVVEVHASDSVGLLYRLTKVLYDSGFDVTRARVSTIGDEVVDSFYLRRDRLDPILADEKRREAFEDLLLKAARGQ